MVTLTKVAHWCGGAALLVAFDLLGGALAATFSLPIPGSVFGMVLLLLALLLYGRVPEGLAQVSEQILRLLVLIFLPASVGIYFLRDLAPGDWLALVAAMVLGTLICFALTALLLKYLIQRAQGRPPRTDPKDNTPNEK
ncbi:CidA/LrgA family protein [Microbulbifer bruguierae]|uniref:CidA/LrgA family protein n=1 Tax=Microbulbifer bruguierae TaxID=3029061 RepID=A0ABY8N9E0_9GAMM|nr:CidA/LrgA family protein [Microbulbifer bruguierae]WGL15501.1 CidA/LrgA family protein [Microbulbifer bruguierae]